MTELYGTRWTSQHGETPTLTWQQGLADMSAADLGTGIVTSVKSGEAWPPSLPEFRAYCRPPRDPAYRAPPGRQLPHLLTPDQRAEGRKHVASIKGMIR